MSEQTCDGCSYELCGWCYKERQEVEPDGTCDEWTDEPIVVKRDYAIGQASLFDLMTAVFSSVKASCSYLTKDYRPYFTKMRHLLNDAEVRFVTGYESHEEDEE